jgi:hypothetical protein
MYSKGIRNIDRPKQDGKPKAMKNEEASNVLWALADDGVVCKMLR